MAKVTAGTSGEVNYWNKNKGESWNKTQNRFGVLTCRLATLLGAIYLVSKLIRYSTVLNADPE